MGSVFSFFFFGCVFLLCKKGWEKGRIWNFEGGFDSGASDLDLICGGYFMLFFVWLEM